MYTELFYGSFIEFVTLFPIKLCNGLAGIWNYVRTTACQVNSSCQKFRIKSVLYGEVVKVEKSTGEMTVLYSLKCS
jgi:hypothetical protein